MSRTWTKNGAVLIVAASVLLVAACSSSSDSGSSSPPSGTGGATQPSEDSHTYKLGVLTDLTGPAASASSTSPNGVKAGVGYYNAHGYKIQFVVKDTGSSPDGALTAAKTLVDQEHVFAVIAVSGLTFSAAPYLTARGVPVFGSAIDNTEWIKSKNMFSVLGYPDYTKVNSTISDIMNLLGGKNLGTLGYGIVPASTLSAKASASAAEAAGLKVGYLNPQFSFFSKDVGPVAIQMKSAGVDTLYGSIEESLAYSLLASLKTIGAGVKFPVLPVGYGGDTLDAGQAAIQAAQGAYYAVPYEPVEMQTPGTKQFVAAMKDYAGISRLPTLNEYMGYLSVDAFVTGLQRTGSNPTRTALINSMLGVTNYPAAGLIGSHTLSFAMDTRGIYQGADNCIWLTKLEGNSFQLIKGALPICGKNLPGKTVSVN